MTLAVGGMVTPRSNNKTGMFVCIEKKFILKKSYTVDTQVNKQFRIHAD